MRSLELKDICGYLPYGFKMLGNNKSIFPVENNLYIDKLFSRICMYENLTPILYTLDALYKPMLHNGEAIIPIVECAKIAFPNDKWKFGYKGHGELKNCAYEGLSDKVFYYAKSDFKCNHFVDGIRISVENQIKLFDYLNELKIDYRGLIDEGLAIDVNTLIINPYK